MDPLGSLNYDYVDEFRNSKYLLRSPYPLAAIIFGYLYFVLKCGPAYMKAKPPFELKKTILVYNFIQILLNGNGLYKCIQEIITNNQNYSCPVLNKNVLSIGYYFLLLKLVDFVETFFFILRKKQSQVSFLHLYHHVVVCAGTYIFLSYENSLPQNLGCVLINCIVHMIMYIYYFISAYDPDRRKYAGFKKFVTQMQLAQFVILTIHFGWPLIFGHCNFPPLTAAFCVSQNGVLIYLFGRFYINTYMNQEKNKLQ